jgi:hypothetical protein
MRPAAICEKVDEPETAWFHSLLPLHAKERKGNGRGAKSNEVRTARAASRVDLRQRRNDARHA